VEGLFGVDPILAAGCENGLLVFEEEPNAKEVEMFVGAVAGTCPKEKPPPEDGVVGPASTPKENVDEGVFWPKPLNPIISFSCFSSDLVTKGLEGEGLGPPPNENGPEPP